MPMTADVGDCLFVAMEIENTALAAPGYYAGMGFGVPAGIGVAAATGRRPLVLVGDGAFQMTGWELGNCRRYRLDPIVVLFNNSSWGMLRAFQPESRFNDLDDWNFAAIAPSLGGYGERVRTRRELKEAIECAVSRRGQFTLIEVMLPREAISKTLARFVSDQRTMFTPERIAIEKLDGTLVAERHAPRDSFAGHQMSTPWDPLHRAYFNGEALWTYLTTPFLLAMDGVRVEETQAWREGSEAWRVLRAYFPGSIETHCLVQDFFFGEDLLLRRHDYNVNIAGGFGASQLTSDYVEANGIRLPTKRRAFTRGPDRRPILEMLMVSIDISDVSFTNRTVMETPG
jgi:Thiamine pyrophosphate enzyme, C-terminal TPP binding domain